MKIFFSVGEPSGDLHGANLIQQIRKLDDSIEFTGYGGPKMQAAGLQAHADLTRFAVMFFWQAITKIPKFLKLYRDARRYFAEHQVDAVVLIDYPGFNWWIAKAAKQQDIPVFYYGVPQMWAWGPWRVRKLKNRVDHVICKLPFEKSWFEKRDCPAHFVGHPYFDELINQPLNTQFLQDFDDSESRLLTLLPGSRDQEVAANLPWLLDAAVDVCDKVSDVSVVVSCFKESHSRQVRDEIQRRGLPFDVMHGRTPELIHLADACLACSGSISLELMFHRTPSVIVYRISPFYAMLKKLFLNCPYITLVNLLWLRDLDRPPSEIPPPDSRQLPFPEYACVSNPARAMSRHVRRWLNRDHARQATQQQLDDIVAQFGRGGASQAAAGKILELLNHSANQPAALENGLRRAA